MASLSNPPPPPQHQFVAQPGLSRTLTLELLERVHDPERGPGGCDPDEEEPEVGSGCGGQWGGGGVGGLKALGETGRH